MAKITINAQPPVYEPLQSGIVKDVFVTDPLVSPQTGFLAGCLCACLTRSQKRH